MGKRESGHVGGNVTTSCKYTITYNWKDNDGNIQSSTVTGTASAFGETSRNAIKNLHTTMNTMIGQSLTDMQSNVSENCTTPNDDDCGCSGPKCDCCSCTIYPTTIEFNYL